MAPVRMNHPAHFARKICEPQIFEPNSPSSSMIWTSVWMRSDTQAAVVSQIGFATRLVFVVTTAVGKVEQPNKHKLLCFARSNCEIMQTPWLPISDEPKETYSQSSAMNGCDSIRRLSHTTAFISAFCFLLLPASIAYSNWSRVIGFFLWVRIRTLRRGQRWLIVIQSYRLRRA